MNGFLEGAGFTPVIIVSSATPTVVYPLQHCLVSWRRRWRLDVRLQGVHGHIYMCKLLHHCCVLAVKEYIGLCQYLQLVGMYLHYLYDCVDMVNRLVMLFWRGGALHRICFVPPRHIPLSLWLLPLSFVRVGIVDRRYLI